MGADASKPVESAVTPQNHESIYSDHDPETQEEQIGEDPNRRGEDQTPESEPLAPLHPSPPLGSDMIDSAFDPPMSHGRVTPNYETPPSSAILSPPLLPGPASSPSSEELLCLLKHHWGGTAEFRGPQLEVIQAVMDGHDGMLVMATGKGMDHMNYFVYEFLNH